MVLYYVKGEVTDDNHGALWIQVAADPLTIVFILELYNWALLAVSLFFIASPAGIIFMGVLVNGWVSTGGCDLESPFVFSAFSWIFVGTVCSSGAHLGALGSYDGSC